MQTFLPYADFARTARVLDDRRLRNQRNEALVILKQLHGYYEKGWPHHPAVKMWTGYQLALLDYLREICIECERRGVRDTVLSKALALGHFNGTAADPPWLGNDAFHRSHRSNLLRKDPEHYRGRPGFDLPDDLPYVWPTTQ